MIFLLFLVSINQLFGVCNLKWACFIKICLTLLEVAKKIPDGAVLSAWGPQVPHSFFQHLVSRCILFSYSNDFVFVPLCGLNFQFPNEQWVEHIFMHVLDVHLLPFVKCLLNRRLRILMSSVSLYWLWNICFSDTSNVIVFFICGFIFYLYIFCRLMKFKYFFFSLKSVLCPKKSLLSFSSWQYYPINFSLIIFIALASKFRFILYCK